MRDAIDRIFSFRDDWNTLRVDEFFSKTEKKIPLTEPKSLTENRLLYYTSLLQKIY